LLIQGVDVNCADGWGRTALHYAVRAAHVDIVTQLLAAGAEIGARDHHGQSPLHVA
ncbi:ankyrin, partial [Aspergillus phoenicis ATCC 13157]